MNVGANPIQTLGSHSRCDDRYHGFSTSTTTGRVPLEDLTDMWQLAANGI